MTPAISIIIPMYNVEKYIGECLDSIFAQTFKDFEVIIVDDCSTDKSREIVEKYASTGGGIFDLRLVRSKINSGNCGTPRNIGTKFSRGEYLMFIDSDDAITPTALEELYTIAKNFQADVVHCERYINVPTEDKLFGRESYQAVGYNVKSFVSEPTLITENIFDRIADLQHNYFMWNVWTKLIRRDFLLENEIVFADAMAEDVAFTCSLVCAAKNYVRVPNVVNLYRVLENSISHKQDDVEKTFGKWLNALNKSFNCLDTFLSGREFFIKNPDAKYAVLDVLVGNFLAYLLDFYRQIPAAQLDALLRAEFEKFDGKSALMAFFFSRMNVFNLQLLQLQSQVPQ